MMQMLNSYYKMLDDSLSKYSVYKARMKRTKGLVLCFFKMKIPILSPPCFIHQSEERWPIPFSLADELCQRQPHDSEWSSSRRERPTLRPGCLRLKIKIESLSHLHSQLFYLYYKAWNNFEMQKMSQCILQIANLALKIFNNANRWIINNISVVYVFSPSVHSSNMIYLGFKNTQHQYELDLINPTNIGSWSPIVLTRVLNSELASTQAMS